MHTQCHPCYNDTGYNDTGYNDNLLCNDAMLMESIILLGGE